MKPINSVYIVEPDNQGWIIERLMRDIAAELNLIGISAKIGDSRGYQGEDVIFNSRYLTAFRDERALVNSLFVTHIDDKLKEAELRSAFKKFNSFVCMSDHDAEFVSSLKGSSTNVAGINLPARNLTVRPIRLAIFSACYDDHRKNEQWILEYFQNKPAEQKNSFVWCLMGWGWETFCGKMGAMEMSYELYRYSRFMPDEYEMYKQTLPSVDKLVYLGFDGGAMSVYDALNAGIDIAATDISYHRDLGSSVTLFNSREEFFAYLDAQYASISEKRAVLNERSISAYVRKLLIHWANTSPEITAEADIVPNTEDDIIVAKFRGRYRALDYTRLRSAGIRFIQSSLIKWRRR